MKDLSFIPPSQKRSRYRIVRRRTLLTLAIIATLATSAVVIQQWVWSGQNPHKTLDVDKALKVLNNPREHRQKRNGAAMWLYEKVMESVKAFKAYEKNADPEFKADATNMLKQITSEAGKK